ncbi:Chromosome partition protein Smc [Thiomonas sp. X19]|uniref:chromosome segregation protein SMC n=1 Tax=Thiomonas sp. X19 TaxID=1050370 RepID=UPI000B75DA8C|nr:chromosome segregation protein SMC [Thiomonas sp. X19]SCC94123.1 Chromosome partition protein Smc [Thiomonas sp. X19]
MRLSWIKLAGFKSFADPVAFQMPGQRIGVVGPNGCGKSNIIDAVRWVLGESKASELRGESMQDVIFSGSSTRKPAGRCSVELVFDNSEHRITGNWGQFTEIAVKRVLTRDGASSYFINNQVVRRRDVQDIFLGTGLGPRAYAIIGQGTITRILESRPEELRVMLEEAAGVSKYKERRRETENRLHGTRENLLRVHDILRELNAQIDKLEQQAAVAQQYQQLQRQLETSQHGLWLLRWQEAQARQTRIAAAAGQAVNALEAQTAQLRAAEAELETLRQAQYAASDALNAAQAELYAAQAQVARLETEIRYVVEARDRALRSQIELGAEQSQWLARQQAAQQDAASAGTEMAEAELLQAEAEARVVEHGEQIPALEARLSDAQMRAAEQRAQAAAAQQRLQAEAERQRALGQQAQQIEQRLQRLQAERRAVRRPDSLRLGDLNAQQSRLGDERDEAEARLQALREQLPGLQDARQLQQAAAQQAAAELGSSTARLHALKALQDKVMTEGRIQPWLARHGLDTLARLWTRIHIEPGWETALEAALRERLAALEVRGLDAMAGFAADPPPAKLVFFAAPQAAAPIPATMDLQPLAALLRHVDPGLRAVLDDWLAGVFTADSMLQAMQRRAGLPPGAMLVTRDGHATTRHSVSLYAADSEQAGMLARAQEIENLERQTKAQQLMADGSRSAALQAEAAWTQAQEQAAAEGRRLQALTQQFHAVQVEWLKLQQQEQESTARAERLDTDLAELAAQGDELAAAQAESEARFEQLDAELGQRQQDQADLDGEALREQAALNEARAKLRALEQQQAEAGYAIRSLQQRQADAQRMAATAQQHLGEVAARLLGVEGELARLSDQTASAGLQDALAVQQASQERLALRRAEHDEIAARLRALEESRLRLEREAEPLRAAINTRQLDEQEARLQGEQFQQMLADAQVDLEQLAASLPQGVQPEQLGRDTQRLQRDIAALGAVNLAALDELGQARERRQFLDAQVADLEQASGTLEDAIRKIDSETRGQLRLTFDAVNEHFGRLFPQLFGGGAARLVMTGEEILDAGVQVMAQPPGKRNSSIHMLSGGEKALTAIALVFGIFHLNPAPFCILDEVDAPLDDSNTERFAQLVRSMSDAIQFLFISHNKIAMEMAEQLVGVTMQEQGVSRIVAVDMDTAAHMAEAVA